MDTTTEYELVVSEGRRPLWCSVLGALGVTAIVFAAFAIYQRLAEFGVTEEVVASCGGFMQVLGYGVALTVMFAISKTVLIDIDTNTLVTRHGIGPIGIKAKSSVPRLQYISVIITPRQYFTTRLFYGNNKYYELFYFDTRESAFAFAERAAERLNIGLLDATERGNFKWTIPRNDE